MPAKNEIVRTRVKFRLCEVKKEEKSMWLLALEACGATLLFVFIVWWTMFSGRKPDETAAPTQSTEKKED
jgi:hypothetical protein